MATQSFTDFVGRGQQNLYQGSAPTATVLPQQEIQRLLAELRRGGARAQNAMRILQSSPSGMQALQAVSAPTPAPAPAPVAPAPAPAPVIPQTAQPTQAVDVQRPVPPRSTNIIGQTIGRGIGPPARAVGRGTGAFGRWVSGTSQSVVGTPGEMRDPLTDETFNTIENLQKGPQGLPTAEEIYKQVEETGDDLRSLPKAEQDLYIVKKQLESVGMDRSIPGRTVEEQVKNARDRLRSSFDVSPTTGQTRGEQAIRGGSNPAVLAQIAALPLTTAFAPGEVAGGLAVGQGGRLFSEATGIGDPAQFEQWGTLGGQFLGMAPKNPASILRQADEIAGLRAAGRPIQGAPGLKSALGLDFAGEELKDIARIGQAIGKPAVAGTRAVVRQATDPVLREMQQRASERAGLDLRKIAADRPLPSATRRELKGVNEGQVELARGVSLPIDDPRIAPAANQAKQSLFDRAPAGTSIRYETRAGGTRRGVIGENGEIIPISNNSPLVGRLNINMLEAGTDTSRFGELPIEEATRGTKLKRINQQVLDLNEAHVTSDITKISRGKRPFVDRLRLEVSKGNLDPDVAEAADIFIRSLPDETLKELGTSFFKMKPDDWRILAGFPGTPSSGASLTGGRVTGWYNTKNALLNIPVNILRGAKSAGIPNYEMRVIPHEVAHHLAALVPKKDVDILNKVYRRENTIDKIKNMQIRGSTLGLGLEQRFPTKFRERQYRYTNLGEYFAEVMADKVTRDIFEEGLNAREKMAFAKAMDRIKDFSVAAYNVLLRNGRRDEAERIYRNLVLGEYSPNVKNAIPEADVARMVVPGPPGDVPPIPRTGFKLPSQFARARVSPWYGGEQSNILFESDFDRALFFATAKGPPKDEAARINRETIKALVREELQARGLDPNKMDEIAAPMRQAVQDAAQATDEFDVAFPAFRYADEAAPTAAPRGAVDLSEKLAPDPTIKNPDAFSPQGQAQIGEQVPRYWYHHRLGNVPIPEDGGINATRIRQPQAADAFRGNYAEGEYIWLSPQVIRGRKPEESLLIDISKLDNNEIRFTGQAEGNILHRGEIPKAALVDPPTTPARQADAAARQAAGEPKLPAGLKRSSPRWKGKTIEWDSDVDKALYIVANPTTRSKAHDKFMDFLQKDAGLSEEEIRILGPTVRDSVTRLGNAEPGNVLRVPALRQGAPVRQPTTPAREVAEEVTPRQLDMFSDPLAPRLVDDPVEAQVTARGAAQPVDTAKAAGVAPDVTEGIPPIPPIILKEGPFSVPIGDSGRGLEGLQDAGTQMEVAFQANTFRKIGEKLSPISRFFDPSLASPESSIGKRLVIVLANLMEEGRLKADRAFTYVQRLGSRQSIFGRIDNQNKFVDGPFAGRTLNEVAENRNKPIVKRLLQSIKLNEIDPKTGRQLTAEDYLIRLQQLDEAASELARKYGAEIGFSPTDEVLFATREIYGKINSEGKVIKVAFPSQAARGKAKTALEHIRLFPTAREATDAGYVLLPYDDVVKVKLQQAYRVGAEEEVAQYVLKNFDFEKIPAPDRTFEQQQAMFRGVVGTSEDAQKLARDYEEAAQSFISESKFRIPLLEAANDLGRTFELAGDASIFTIQLFFTLIRDMLLPVYGIRSSSRTARIPGSLFGRSAKDFARTFVTGLRDPERAKALNAKMIDEAREELTGTRIAIFSMPGESPEFTRGVGRLADLQEFFEGKVSRIPGAIPALRGATFPIRRIAAAGQEGYIAVQNMAGIYLYRALRETARKADGTLDPKLLNDVEDNINVMRGITSTERLGVSATQRSIENMALLAPRYRKAVLSMYKNALQGGLRGQLARENLLTGIAGMHLAGLIIVMAKAKAEGKSDERMWHEVRETLIPGGGSYFVTQAGGAMVGFGGKTVSDIRFVANLLRAGTDPEAISRTIQNWIRGQISFVGQDFWTIGTGRGYMGEAVTPWAKKQIGQDEGGVPVEEWGPGFGKWAARHGSFIWLQSMALDGGSASSRTAKGSSEFIGGRGYEQGKKQLLEDASWDRFEKPYSDLNLLERDTLKRDPEIGPQLLEFDLYQAKNGNKYAGYNVTKAAQKEKKERLNQTALDVLVQDMNDKRKVHAGNKMGGGVRDILKEFSDTVKENEREEFYANKGHRGKYGMTGYTGKEPTNDFDKMLNDWYALYDKNTKGTQQLDWDLLEKDQKAFIANLSPELAGQLQEWRDRESGVPGVEELKELRGPKKDEQGNEIVHPDTKTYASGRVVKNKQAGEPVFYNNIELAIEIWNVILASEQGEAGYTQPEMSRVLERDYGVETLPAYKGETLPPPVSVYGEPIVDPTR